MRKDFQDFEEITALRVIQKNITLYLLLVMVLYALTVFGIYIFR